MPTAYILVGVPGSGKSTWIKNQKWSGDCAIVSTDDYVEAFARSVNRTYSEVFDEVMKAAVRQMTEDVIAARLASKDIIWDQTSTTAGSRVKKINMLHGYTRIAVVFKTPEESEWKRRLNSRPGKHIPEHVLKSMQDNFEHPSLEEGFDQIWYAQ